MKSTVKNSKMLKINIMRRFVFILPICFLSASAENSVQLFFKDSVLVNDTVFTFGDICRINCSNSLIKSQLQKNIAGVCAPPGYSRFVNVADLVEYRLKANYKSFNFEISGVQRIVVRTDFEKKKISDYLQVIEKSFENTVSWPEGCWKLKVTNPDQGWKCLRAPLDVKVEGVEPYPKGHFSVDLVVTQGTRRYNIPVVCQMTVVIPVVISIKTIQTGEPLNSDACELKVMDITRLGPLPLKDLQSVQGYRAARTIPPGMIIHRRLITEIPLIEKNERVEIILQRGRVKVAVQGVARESGGKDELIWVENLVSHKLIRAAVVQKGTVIVYQGGTSI
ncbi:MAG: flagellar basal body P-ring formation protein FlgA [Fibrobacter sp.]|nr:flagellar basal body P-ring formation protein FlgA [Fibrobacter sp.]